MTGKIMRALQYHGYGGGADALKHVEVPVPSPQKGEVLLKLEAASINPIDWKIQNGMLRPFLPPRFPYIPGKDVAGEVVEVGPGVDSFKPGDKVVAMLAVKAGGGLAEYATASAGLTVARPPKVSAQEGAGLPTAGLTALQTLKNAGVKFDGTPNEPSNVLITAASGGVGLYAVQLTKIAGLHITATCGSRNIELVKTLGADEVLDYKSPEGSSLKSPSGRKYDYVIHCATGFGWSTLEPTLTSAGKVMDINPNPRSMLTSAIQKVMFSKKRLQIFMVSQNVEDLKFLLELVKEGKVKTVVDSTYPLEKAEEGWAKSINGHATGKIIVEI